MDLLSKLPATEAINVGSFLLFLSVTVKRFWSVCIHVLGWHWLDSRRSSSCKTDLEYWEIIVVHVPVVAAGHISIKWRMTCSHQFSMSQGKHVTKG